MSSSFDNPSLTSPQTSAQRSSRPVILAVDDTPDNLTVLNELLGGTYHVKVANGGARALQIAARQPLPDLILLDIMMPEMDGYEVCRRLQALPETRNIPIIFLTALSDPEAERQGLETGAVDFVTKPFNPPVLLARVKTHLALKSQAEFLRDQSALLAHEVDLRTREILETQDVTIFAMASLAETRDSETGNHIRRTQFYVKALAEHLRSHPRYAGLLTPRYIDLLFKSAPLHDIGKVGIPDNILLKPGRLTPEEFEIMKTHAALGREAIEHAEQELGLQVEFLTLAKEIAQSHHEKWNGEGYPEQLRGDAIPLSARLMAVADVYDALISRRVYKPALPHAEAAAAIAAGRGQHFDPDIVDAFFAIEDELQAIAERFSDANAVFKSL